MPRGKPRRAAIAVLGVGLPGVVLGLLGSWLLRRAGLAVPAWYGVSLAVAAFSLTALAKGLLSGIETPTAPAHGRTPPPDPLPDVLAPLERRLGGAVRERRLYVAGLQPLLYALARERLRLHHSLDLDRALERDPDEARHVLGDELWQWMRKLAPDGPPPTAQQLQNVITAIEAL